MTEEEVGAFLKSIDCYIMGSRTYEQALELGWPYGNKPVIVLTNRDLTIDRENVQFYSGDLEKLINNVVKPNYLNIWMVGGAKLAKDFICLKLADDIIISIMPVILGDGILFFDFIGQEHITPKRCNSLQRRNGGVVL